MKKLNITGKRFGKLVAIKTIGKNKNGGYMWQCKCDCGNEITASVGNLNNGHTKSCGCLRADRCKTNFTKHGLESTRLYDIWRDMRLRCYDERNISYNRYGGRGITICDEWKEDVKAFYDWAIKNGYNDGLTIERIDNDGNYSPENCRWATVKEQANNRRSNVLVTHKGKTQTMKEWANEVGTPYKVVWARMQKLGWSVERALTDPVRKGKWK